MDRQQIIMTFTTPPGIEELTAIAKSAFQALPEEVLSFCEELCIQVEEFPDTAIENELDLQDPYELVALFRSGGQISPGVQKKVANDDDALIIYRRPLLDMWCETGEDLSGLMRQIMIEELAQNFDFSEDEIAELTRQAY